MDVLFDIDNTLSFFNEGLCAAVNGRFGTHYMPADLTKYPVKRILTPQQWAWFRHQMKYTPEFILGLAPNKTAIAAAQILQRAGHVIVICTDRNDPANTAGPTKSWLAKWSVPCDRFISLGDNTKEQLAQQYHAAKVPAALFDDDPRKWQFWPSPLTPLFVPQQPYTPTKQPPKGVMIFTDWNVPLHVLGAPSLSESDALLERRARMGDTWAREELRKGGPGSGAQPGHAFEGNQWTSGSGGGNNQFTATLSPSGAGNFNSVAGVQQMINSMTPPKKAKKTAAQRQAATAARKAAAARKRAQAARQRAAAKAARARATASRRNAQAAVRAHAKAARAAAKAAKAKATAAAKAAKAKAKAANAKAKAKAKATNAKTKATTSKTNPNPPHAPGTVPKPAPQAGGRGVRLYGGQQQRLNMRELAPLKQQAQAQRTVAAGQGLTPQQQAQYIQQAEQAAQTAGSAAFAAMQAANSTKP